MILPANCTGATKSGQAAIGARAYRQLSELDLLRAARKHATQACKLDPDDGYAWSLLAVLSERLGDREVAIKQAKRAIRCGGSHEADMRALLDALQSASFQD